MTSIFERLKGVLRPGGYDPGDTVKARIKDIDGVERDAAFRIDRYCGGGFAGQVYRATVVICDQNWLTPGHPYALKFFRTRSGLRKRFRDVMYFLAFQSPFPHQFNEAAVRTGVFMTRLLRIVSKVEFGTEAPINDCYGSFWDDHVGSFAEVDEWVEGRVSDPDVDSGIFTRRSHNRRVWRERRSGNLNTGPMMQSDSEIAAKRRFMDAWVRMCSVLGIEDLARQVYWWTGMSQPNVLTRTTGEGLQFVWVDRRPGLPGFLLSLGDFPLLFNAILRGSIPPFDRINFKKLRNWSKAPNGAEWESLVDRLHEIDDEYHRAQVDIIGHHFRLIADSRLKRSVMRGIVDYWRRTGRIDGDVRGRLIANSLRAVPHLLLSCIPILGCRLQKFVGNAGYREHIRRMFGEASYRWDYFDRRRKIDLAMWLRDNRIAEGRGDKCLRSLPAYFRDLIFFSWQPPTWQRFFTDWATAKDSLRRLFTSPLKYVFVVPYRRKVNLDWVHERTEEDVRHGYVSREEAEVFTSIGGSETMQKYVTGIMVTLALQPASELVFIALAAILGIKGLSDFEGVKHSIGGLGWWAVPLGIAFVAVSPAGILRFVYCIVQWIRNRHVPYGTALSLSLFRAIGDLAFIIQTARTYPQFSGYLLTSSLCHLVGLVPVFGERGGLLNIWVATAVLSWPASWKAWLGKRRG